MLIKSFTIVVLLALPSSSIAKRNEHESESIKEVLSLEYALQG